MAARVLCRLAAAALILMIGTTIPSTGLHAQSGSGVVSGRRSVSLNVVVHGPEGRVVTRDDFDLYDGGIGQEVDGFARLDAGTRIVLMVDNSANLRVEAADLYKAAQSVVEELYADDEMMVIGYNESAEIIEDMTPDISRLRASVLKFKREGFPNLFDALVAVADTLAQGAHSAADKRAIILISDGYDSESKMKFDQTLHALQETNVLVYALRVADRTRGALLRDKPKPPAVLEQLTAGTGGLIFPFDQAETAARKITEELRKHWYRLVYTPSGVNPINKRRLLLMSREKGIELRTKGSHPGRFR